MDAPFSHYVKVSISGEEKVMFHLNSAREAYAVFDREIFLAGMSAWYPFGLTQVDVFAVMDGQDLQLQDSWVKREY